jgi:glycosyltransferase involved in cell wall biosynthesis
VPVVVARRDLGYWRTPRRTEILRRTHRLAAAVLANADAVKAETVAAEHVPPGRVAVVRNGHTSFGGRVADPGLRVRLGIPADARVLGLVANRRPLKRQEDLVEALGRLVPAHPDLHALFVGEGEFAPHLARAEELGVRDHVHVDVAKGRPVSDWLLHLHAGVLCSETEGLSNALLEYMACGLPVVATRVGGNPELVRDGVDGLLYAPGDVGGLVAALEALLADPARARRMGDAARRRASEAFTAEGMAATRAVQRAAMSRGGGRSCVLEVQRATCLTELEPLEPVWRRLAGRDRFFLAMP